MTELMPDTTTDEGQPTCRLVRAGEELAGKQGHLVTPGISAQSVGAQRIHLQIVRIPPGVRSKAHKHENHESAIYVLSGESGTWYGDKLQHHLIARAGDFLHPRQYAASALQSERYGKLRGCRRTHRSQRAGECRFVAGTREPAELARSQNIARPGELNR